MDRLRLVLEGEAPGDKRLARAELALLEWLVLR
jgi:hypothetical protein